MPPQPLDADAVRRWCRFALDALGRARREIDAINVYPVADGDTGTNLYLTVESAAQAVEAAAAAGPGLAQAARAMAHGALIGARGNSGTILAQLLRGMAEAFAEHEEPADAETLRRALRRAASSAYQAVAHPVEGTMLSVAAAAAAEAAEAGPAPGAGGAAPGPAERQVAEVLAAACAAARAALARTPGQLAVLARAGVVDAGGTGLVAVLEALDEAVSGRPPDSSLHHHGLAPAAARPAAGPGPCPEHGRPAATAPGAPPGAGPGPGPGYEVIYLLEAADEAVAALRSRLDALGESLVVVGGDGLWNVHVHTDEPGAAVEHGIEAGRPYRIRISHLGAATAEPVRPQRAAAARAVVAVMPGDGLSRLCEEAGAVVLTTRPGEPPGSGELAAAVLAAGAGEVVLLPNDAALRHAAAAAADEVRAAGVRIAVVPTRSPVQGIAALAVHSPERRFDEDVVAMTSAAGATRYGEVGVAEAESWTTAGVCQAGDVLGLIDGDVAVIGTDPHRVAAEVLERMMSAGGELVTLVLGEGAPPDLAERLRDQVRHRHLGAETVVFEGRQTAPLLIGVE
ncbi:DAK2 domain-containing protein [Streptomyces aidingensis]|uniref:DhaL domain-containing protein n=1 Tax=Streptomyces aidingensis TaxID=910347 RepID=A0A1I1NQQ3_9ACTN|nr:DAK2 domain-containing protein [Streptomyces aidingensis]SFC99867.1 hypothetical protein SAMN05421773_108127 [Streptomyces aidingensis]